MHKFLFFILYVFSFCGIVFSFESETFEPLWYVAPVFIYLNIRLYIKYDDYINYQRYDRALGANVVKHKTYNYDTYEYAYYPQNKNDSVSQYDKIGECVQPTNNIVSYKETDRVISVPTTTPKEEVKDVATQQDNNDWKSVVSNVFLNPKRTDTTIVIDSGNRLTVPQSELTSATVYSCQTKKEEYPKNAILKQNTDKITPYKSKIYNDIIYILSTVYDNPNEFNTACVSITHIECMENKCLIFVNMRTIKSLAAFPYSEITKKIQERLGGEFEILFEADQTVSLHEYMITTLKEKKESYVGKFT